MPCDERLVQIVDAALASAALRSSASLSAVMVMVLAKGVHAGFAAEVAQLLKTTLHVRPVIADAMSFRTCFEARFGLSSDPSACGATSGPLHRKTFASSNTTSLVSSRPSAVRSAAPMATRAPVAPERIGSTATSQRVSMGGRGAPG